ncbi:hypothetical protein PsYK624_027970 [Phanerochaete sordida]|uniref:Uncharacterized protein n=1 Tax=Phanerochaete sordida TaxID=48140 RepID=A0A9P3G1W0_9APHY|nr:hypothetical protein PsYK624_027970 [Phanerochaete sordida]
MNFSTIVLLVAALAHSLLVRGINEYPTISSVASVPKPAACGNSGTIPAGGWLANKPCGYVMGTASAGQRFDVESTSSAGFHFGRYRGSSNWCTWILPSALDTSHPVSVASSCSTTTQSALCNRQAFGVDFDAPPHVGDGAIIIPLDLSGCTGYYNYFVDTNFVSGAFQDPVPFALPASGGGYRYSSRDRVASIVRAPIAAYGGETVWFWVPRLCIATQLAGHMLDNSGGDSC